MSTTQAQATRLFAIFVGLVTMALSYHALAERAQEVGFNWWLSWVYPLGLDGLLGLGMLAARVVRKGPRGLRAYVWGVIGFGIGVSALGNALPHHLPELWADLFRAAPPISFALTLHLYVRLGQHEPATRPSRRETRSEQPEPQQSLAIVRPLPSTSEHRSGSARARSLFAQARADGRAIKAPELAKQAGVSESRARAVIAQMTRDERLAVDSR